MHRQVAMNANAPTVAESDDGNFIHLSIFDGKYLNFLVCSRVIVTYNKRKSRLDCRCGLNRLFCLHNALALWYLHQTNKICDEIITSHDQTQFDGEVALPDESLDGIDLDTILYPPTDDGCLVKMIEYWKLNKKFPISTPRMSEISKP